MHIGYCTNIHPGEDWTSHFAILQESLPSVKGRVSPDKPMGVGLRLANQASQDLQDTALVATFRQWLDDNGLYVFTMNGFPYGGFHNTRVKDQVHTPDWTTNDRADYTIRMFRILAQLLPDTLTDGGISTSPISYRYWWKTPDELAGATETGTRQMLRVVEELIALRRQTGKLLHLDIEPEPDGILESGPEFLDWYQTWLLPIGITYLGEKLGLSADEAATAIRDHIQLCYDVCHFAVGYENPVSVLDQLQARGIRVGKIQVSSALKVDFSSQADEKLAAIAGFDEPTYLHQVVARLADGSLKRFADLPEALEAFDAATHQEWRVHFHVPLFVDTYGLLESTQSAIREVLALNQERPFTDQLELETYTWGVLPESMQLPLNESISREMAWVMALHQ